MKFKLDPYHRNISDEELLADLRRVAQNNDKNTLTKAEYNENGKYHCDTFRRRFGSWFSALSNAGLNKSRSHYNIPENKCLDDLRRVAIKLGRDSVTRNEYKDHGKYSPTPFIRHFGSWFSALDRAGLKKTCNYNVSIEEYFENLESLWRTLGRQPRYSEVRKPFSKYSSSAYEKRFGSWRKALEAFVDYVNREENRDQGQQIPKTSTLYDTPKANRLPESRKLVRPKTSRTPSWRLRFLVMRRDNFRCCNCGKSPANTTGIILHIDHVAAWSKGGETVLENLQTLCQKCNIGKSDLPAHENSM